MSVNDIQTAYRNLWKVFQDAAEVETRSVDASGQGPQVRGIDGGGASASAIFVLRDWPYRVASSKKVDIAVEVAETFSPKSLRVTRATTRVGYFHREMLGEKQIRRPVLELHYDFEVPVQEAHPTFHAQLGEVDWPKEVDRLGLSAIERDDNGKPFAQARIPTAFMGYVPILVTLAADHLQPKSFRRVIAAARKTDIDLDCASLTQRLGAARGIHGHQWYDERYTIHIWREGKKHFFASCPVLNCEEKGPDEKQVHNSLLQRLGVTPRDVEVIRSPPSRTP